MRDLIMTIILVYCAFFFGEWYLVKKNWSNPRGVMSCKQWLEKTPWYGHIVLPGYGNACLDILMENKK